MRQQPTRHLEVNIWPFKIDGCLHIMSSSITIHIKLSKTIPPHIYFFKVSEYVILTYLLMAEMFNSL